MTDTTDSASPRRKRTIVKQTDVPGYSLQDALRVPRAIADNYGKQPTRPLDVAAAMKVKTSSGGFKGMAGAAVAYGLTKGGPNAESIALTDLGRRVISPTEEGDDVTAMREALMKPRVVREFLQKYDGSKLPNPQIGQNVLEQMGVAAGRTDRVLKLIVSSAESLGLLSDIKGDTYVNLRPSGSAPIKIDMSASDAEEDDDAAGGEADDVTGNGLVPDKKLPEFARPPASQEPPTEALTKNRRVFVTHGKNKKIVDQLKELLVYGDFEPVVSVERQTVSKPVPDKVLGDMRQCSAAIIHVGTDRVIRDEEGKEHHLLNENVLIEIGAAMALYGGRFILLVEEGTTLPSNLQGLYEVRFEGASLDYNSTMKLLSAFNEFKK